MQSGNEFEIDSCGVGGWHSGELPDKRMRATAASYGVQLEHRARQIRKEDFEYYDHLFVMDHQNFKDVSEIAKEGHEKIKMFTHFSSEHKNEIIPDPYYGSEKDFDDVYRLIDSISKELAQNLLT